MTGPAEDHLSQILRGGPFRLAPFRFVIPLMAMQATEQGQMVIYESLLNIPWLAPEIRYAVDKVLGRTTSQQNEKFRRDKAHFAAYMVAERKAMLRLKGWPRGSGSIDLAARKQTADKLKMTDSALADLLRYYGPKGEERRRLQEKAQRIASQLAEMEKRSPPTANLDGPLKKRPSI
jgi:hypothetical protein